MKRLVVLLTLLVAAWALSVAWPVAGPVAAQSGAVATFQTASLSIETAAGDAHDFQVEIAETGEQRAQGLMRSVEHTSELQSIMRISYAVFYLINKKV